MTAERRSGDGGRRLLGGWTVRGAGLGIGLLIVFVSAQVVQAAMNVVVLIFISILLAAAIDPLVDAVRGRVSIGRGKVVLGVYVALLVAAIVLVLLLVPAAADQVTELSQRLPGLITETRDWAGTLQPDLVATTLSGLLDTLETTLQRGGVTSPDPDVIVELGLSAADAALAVITVFTLVFFWLVSRETMQRFGLSLLPLERRASVRGAWNEVERRMGFWVRGQLTLMITLGVVTTIAYFLLGLPNALLLGVIAGIAELIPIVGPAIGAIPALLVAFVEGGPEMALLVAGVYIVIQVVEGNVLVPVVMRNAVGLPPFVVVVSLLVGAAVAGLIGALLAVPFATALAVIAENAQDREAAVAFEAPAFGEEADDEEEAETAETAAARSSGSTVAAAIGLGGDPEAQASASDGAAAATDAAAASIRTRPG